YSFLHPTPSPYLPTPSLHDALPIFAMTTGYPALAVVMGVAVLASVALLMPRHLRLHRLAALDAEHPASYPVRIALVAGAWIGYEVNDTGPVLIAAMLGIWPCQLPVVLPAPPRTGAPGR